MKRSRDPIIWAGIFLVTFYITYGIIQGKELPPILVDSFIAAIVAALGRKYITSDKRDE